MDLISYVWSKVIDCLVPQPCKNTIEATFIIFQASLNRLIYFYIFENNCLSVSYIYYQRVINL